MRYLYFFLVINPGLSLEQIGHKKKEV